MRQAVDLIPLRSDPFGSGFEAMLFNGTLAAGGLAMIIPLFVPSRWRRSTVDDEDFLASLPTAPVPTAPVPTAAVTELKPLARWEPGVPAADESPWAISARAAAASDRADGRARATLEE